MTDATADTSAIEDTAAADAAAAAAAGTGDAGADAAAAAEAAKAGEGEGDDVSLIGKAGEGDDAKPGEGEGEQTEEQKAAALAVPFEGLKAPEGFEALDDDLLTQATPLMRAQGIDTPEKAQAFVDQFAPVLKSAVDKAMSGAADQQTAAISEQSRTWVEETRAHPEFGGAKLQENLAHAARFRDRFFTSDGAKALVREAPLFNHPEIVGAFIAAGKALAEDTIHQSDHAAQVQKTPGQIMYGDMKPVDSSGG